MRARTTLRAERARLETALKATRDKLIERQAATGGFDFRLSLDEAMLQGQIRSIDYALSTDDGGWPHDALAPFLDARANAIRSMRAAGKSPAEICQELNISPDKALLIAVFDEADSKN